jgi:hypothetical protein
MYWFPSLTPPIDIDNFDINFVTNDGNYLLYKDKPLVLKTEFFIHYNTSNKIYQLKSTNILRQLQGHNTDFIEIVFSPSTSLANDNGVKFTELGLDIFGDPCTFMLPDKDFKCILTAFFSIDINQCLICHPMNVQYIKDI